MATSTSNDAVDPVDQFLDLVLYAPLGLVAKSIDALPELAQRGRANATNARVLGQFALGATNARARSAIADAEQHIAAFLAIVAESASPKRSSTSPAENSTAQATVYDEATSINDVIAEYDTLTAAEIVPLLAPLSDAQRERVQHYELAHRARKTVLNRLRQLQG